MKLQEQVQAKELQITNLKEQERQYVSQLETLRVMNFWHYFLRFP